MGSDFSKKNWGIQPSRLTVGKALCTVYIMFTSGDNYFYSWSVRKASDVGLVIYNTFSLNI